DAPREAQAAERVPPIGRTRKVARLPIWTVDGQLGPRTPVPSAGEHVERPGRAAHGVSDERLQDRLPVAEVEASGVAAEYDRFRSADRDIKCIDAADEPLPANLTIRRRGELEVVENVARTKIDVRRERPDTNLALEPGQPEIRRNREAPPPVGG